MRMAHGQAQNSLLLHVSFPLPGTLPTYSVSLCSKNLSHIGLNPSESEPYMCVLRTKSSLCSPPASPLRPFFPQISPWAAPYTAIHRLIITQCSLYLAAINQFLLLLYSEPP